jgi:hypothetical protein
MASPAPCARNLYMRGQLESSATLIETSPLEVRVMHSGNDWWSVGTFPACGRSAVQDLVYTRWVDEGSTRRVETINKSDGLAAFQCGAALPMHLVHESPAMPAYRVACALVGLIDSRLPSCDHAMDTVAFDFVLNRSDVAVSLCSSTDKRMRLDLFALRIGARFRDRDAQMCLSVGLVGWIIELTEALRVEGGLDSRATMRLQKYSWLTGRVLTTECHAVITSGDGEELAWGVTRSTDSR